MTEERWESLMQQDEIKLTEQEVLEGWHSCPDWDGLVIGPGMMELESCLCSLNPNPS